MPTEGLTTGAQFREAIDRQIKIQACPGRLQQNSGAPLVKISALLPGQKKRLQGQGNSLWEACQHFRTNAWREGIELPMLETFERDQGLTP